MPRIIDLPAQYEWSEGLDGPWDEDDLTTQEEAALNLILDPSTEREVAVEALLSIIGSRLDDADLTTIQLSKPKV